MTDLAIELDDLQVVYRVRGKDRQVLRGVSLTIERGESYGLVGESGCGKTTAAFAIMRSLPRNGRVVSGSIRVNGEDLLRMGPGGVRNLRATTLSMVYQNPGSALNPAIRIGPQLQEVFELIGASKESAAKRAHAMLEKVQISDPARVMRRYPHQLSGGMQQRVVIAMALAKDPTLLILDEPTTGLDATVEAEVLELIAALRQEFGTTVLFISHNLAVIAKMCERVGVLYAGRLVEEGIAQDVFRDPRHPYTVGLLRCIPRGGVQKDETPLDTIPGFLPPIGAEIQGCVFAPRCGLVRDVCREEEPPLYPVGDGRTSRCHFHQEAHLLPRNAPGHLMPARQGNGAPLLALENVAKTYRQEGQDVHALSEVSLGIKPGEVLGLVGESGSGKTTLARVLLGLTSPDPGTELELAGTPLAAKVQNRSREQVRALQVVFQNPDSALNRRFSVRRIIERAVYKLRGLHGEERSRRARDLASAVRFDESKEGVTYLFISHDLGVVRYISDRIAVLYLGHLLELGDAETVFKAPHHPYTEALLSAVPSIEGAERTRIRLEGEIPSAADPPSGCVFHTRCPRKIGPICEQEMPPLEEVEPGHFMRCHIPLDELRALQTAPPAARYQSKTTS
jgi:peptide/nickel transport system ATP-binding protein